jgi:hypothetical protein
MMKGSSRFRQDKTRQTNQHEAPRLERYPMSKTLITTIKTLADLEKALANLPALVIPEGTIASEVRAMHQRYEESHNLGFMPVTGRTFPLRKLLWVLGGKWDKEAKVQMIPAHNWKRAQEAVNAITAKVEANIAECAIKRQAKAEAEAAAKAKAEATKAKRAETARKNLEKARAAKAAKAQAQAVAG